MQCWHCYLYRVFLLSSPCCLKTSNNMHRTFTNLKLLQNHSIFRHVSATATTTIKESSPCKLEQCCYKHRFFLLWTRSKIHFTTSVIVKLCKHCMCSGVEIVEHWHTTHSNSKWMSHWVLYCLFKSHSPTIGFCNGVAVCILWTQS
jgi:hypothetical protein